MILYFWEGDTSVHEKSVIILYAHFPGLYFFRPEFDKVTFCTHLYQHNINNEKITLRLVFVPEYSRNGGRSETYVAADGSNEVEIYREGISN